MLPGNRNEGPRWSAGKMKRLISFLLVLALLPAVALADLEAHFLDVGQGDCAVVICDGEAMVIDGGPRGASSMLYSYLRKTLGLRHVDYVVSTHPHVDHVYGLSTVLNAVSADVLFSPVTAWDSKAFEHVLRYAARQGTPVTVPAEGDTFRLGGALVTILHCWPEAIAQERTNDSSIVLRIDYGKTSFLLTGDAESKETGRAIDSGTVGDIDFLKVGHHGSAVSITARQARALDPEVSVASAGEGNAYGHPNEECVHALEAAGSMFLCTKEVGDVEICPGESGPKVRMQAKRDTQLLT